MPFKNEPTLYSTWINMKSRCNNPNWPRYDRYGGRGIKICSEWELSYKQFENDMGPKPTQKHTLERRDNDKGYSPENCYWATKKAQNRNQSWTRKVLIEGVKHIVAELSENYGIKTDTIVSRAARGLTFSQVVAKGKTVCNKGHPFVPENTYLTPNGTRKCKICIRTTDFRRGKIYWSKPILVEMI